MANRTAATPGLKPKTTKDEKLSTITRRVSGNVAPTPTTARPKAISRPAVSENKRPSSRTTSTLSSSAKTAKTAPSADKTRRTTTTSIPPKRPSTLSSSRTNTKTDLKADKAPSVSQSGPSTTSTPTGTSVDLHESSTTAARPVSRDPIPEESESVTPTKDVASAPSVASSTATTHSPRKLEIRSTASTPSIKPQALSDVEPESRQQRITPRHSRARSLQVDKPDDEGMRNIQMMTNLLRATSEKDTLSSQIDQLKADNARLREAVKKFDNTHNNTIPARAQEEHAKEIEDLKTSHQAAITALESDHTTELEKIRTELDQQQHESFKLKGVESKIQAVERALHENKARASRNEEELQKKVEDRDQLAAVVQDLKAEIDRCQKQLDDDVAKQSEEKQEALQELEKFKQEMAIKHATVLDLMSQVAEQADEKKEALQDIEKLKQEMVDERATVEDLRAQIAKQADEKKEALQKIEKLGQGTAEGRATVEGLKAQIARQAEERDEALRQIEEERTSVKDLREEITSLKATTTSLASERDSAIGELADERATVTNLKEHIATLNATETSLACDKDHALGELADERATVKGLREQIAKLAKEKQEAQQEIADERATLNDLRAQLTDLNTTASSFAVEHDRRIGELQDSHAKLAEEKQKALQEIAEKQATVDELKEQIANLNAMASSSALENDRRIRELQDGHAKLVEQKQEALQETANEQANVKDLKEQIAKLNARASMSASENDRRIRELLDDYTKLLGCLRDHLGLEDNATAEDLIVTVKDLKEQIANLNATASSLASENDHRVGELQNGHTKLLGGLREHLGLEDSATAEILMDELALLVSKKYRVEGELEDLGEQITSLTATASSLASEKDHAIGERTKLLDGMREHLGLEDSASAENIIDELALLVSKKYRVEGELEDERTEKEKVVDGLRIELALAAESATKALEEQKADSEKVVSALRAELALAQESATKALNEQKTESEKIVDDLRAEIESAIKSQVTPATPQKDDDSPSAEETERKAETPLAYHSDEEMPVPSPTPAYPREGKRAGSEMEVSTMPTMNLLRNENEELVEQLEEAMEENNTPTINLLRKEKEELAEQLKEAMEEIQVLQRQKSASESKAREAVTPEQMDDPFSAPRKPPQTLEGTLKSLLVQTEHLLEANDDIAAENRRVSARLRMPLRSGRRRTSFGMGSSPSVAAGAS